MVTLCSREFKVKVMQMHGMEAPREGGVSQVRVSVKETDSCGERGLFTRQNRPNNIASHRYVLETGVASVLL